MTKERRFLVYGVAVIIAIFSVWFGKGEIGIADDASDKLLDLGAALLISAILVERVIELLVGSPRRKEALDEPEGKVEEFREETRLQTRSLGLLLGVILAFVGVRTLSVLFDPGTSETAESSLQFNLLIVLDVFLTGALIGGGSSGIHDILSKISGALRPEKPTNSDSNFSG